MILKGTPHFIKACRLCSPHALQAAWSLAGVDCMIQHVHVDIIFLAGCRQARPQQWTRRAACC